MNPAPISWRETRLRSLADLHRLRSFLESRDDHPHHFLHLHPSYLAVRLYRVSHYLWRRGMGKAARLVSQLDLHLTGFDFHPQCDLGGGLLLLNPAGTSTSGNAGRNLTMFPVSGIGMRPDPRDVGAGPGHPVCGDDVVIGPLAGVLGPALIGDGVCLQAGAAPFRDVPAHTMVVPALSPSRSDAAGAEQMRATALGQTLPRRASTLHAHHCPHESLRATLRDFDQDIQRYVEKLSEHRGGASGGSLRKLSALTTTQLLTTGLYRLSHYLHAAGWRRWALAVARFNFLIHKATINPGSCLGGGAFLPHPVGLVICARAGQRLTMYARALCTSHRAAFIASIDEGPVLGDDVIFVAHAAVLGPVRVGDNVRVGGNTKLYEDAASDTAIVSSSVRVKLVGLDQFAGSVIAHGGTAAVSVLSNRATAIPSALVATCLPRPISWAQTRRRMDQDWRRLRDMAGGSDDASLGGVAPALLAARLHRISYFFQCRGRHGFARLFWQLNHLLNGVDIHPASDLQGGLALLYPAGVSIHAVAGRNLTVLALAGVSGGVGEVAGTGARRGRPELGDNVLVGHQSGIYGPVRVGDGVYVAPGCFVTSDVASNVVMVPPRIRFQRIPRGAPGAAAQEDGGDA